MAAGDFVVRRNASNTDTYPDAGSDLLLLWDTSVGSSGSGITYSAGTFTLGETGKFLVFASDRWSCNGDVTANERRNAKTTLTLGGTELQEGFSTGYIRNDSSSDEFINFCAAIIDVTSTTGTADELQIRSERVDNSTAGTISRVADRSGITIVKLDDSWNYARYESSAAFTPSATDNTRNTADIGTTLEEASPFTRTGNVVDIATNNLVLAVYSFAVDTTDVLSGRTEMQGVIDLAGTEMPGSWSQTYGPRVTDDCNLGGMSCAALLEPTSGDDLTLMLVGREDIDEDWFASLQLVELPAGAEACIVEATTGEFNSGTGADFAWDTNPYIDTDAFTHTVGNANIDVDNADDYLVLSSLAVTSDAGQPATRSVPAIGFRVNTTDTNVTGNSSYNRGTGTADHPAVATGALLTGLAANDSIYTRYERIGATATAQANDSGAMSVIRLSSLFGSSEDALLADDVQSTSEVGAPALGQEHALLADDAQSTSEVGTPAVGQEHALLADDVQSTSEVSSPALAESNVLLADDVQSTSEVGSPAVGQEHSLLADDVQSTSEVGTPAVGQEHGLLADDVQSTSEVSAPVLAGVHVLFAGDVQSTSEVSAPVLGQKHGLLAENVESASEVSQPALIEGAESGQAQESKDTWGSGSSRELEDEDEVIMMVIESFLKNVA